MYMHQLIPQLMYMYCLHPSADVHALLALLVKYIIISTMIIVINKFIVNKPFLNKTS